MDDTGISIASTPYQCLSLSSDRLTVTFCCTSPPGTGELNQRTPRAEFCRWDCPLNQGSITLLVIAGHNVAAIGCGFS